MTSKKKKNRKTVVPSYETVINAVYGDEFAMVSVLHFFDSAINDKSKRPYIDEKGNCRYYVDPFVRGHIIGGLMEAILDFRKHIND